MSRTKKKVSAFTVVEIILIVILVLVMITMLAVNFMFKNKNSAVSLFGYSFYNTKASNMLPNIPQNTLVIAKTSEKDNIEEGSVILCKIGESTILTRIYSLDEKDGQKIYVAKYDNDKPEDNRFFNVSPDAVIAKAVWQIDGFGHFIDFASSTVGIIIAVVIPLIFIIAIQVARILSIHRLEDEAASLDDIDEFMTSREEDSPSPVTFSEPKFIEDITGNFSKLNQPGVTAYKEEREAERPPEKVLSVDGRGKAAYVERKPDASPSDSSPLYTYDRISKERQQQKEPAAVGAKAVSKDDLYVNRPTRIVNEHPAAEEFFKKYAPKQEPEPDFEKGEPVVFTPHLSNIIPESIAAVQEKTDSPKKPATFDESVKTYFDKKYVPAEEKPAPSVKAAIPENAVLPKETIAPPRKARSNKAVAELMSIIDAEETKMKK